MRDSRSHAAMASRYHPERQTFLTPPTPPATPPSAKVSRQFPSITASKGEVKSYIRAVLTTNPQHQPRQSAFWDKTSGGMSTLTSFRSIRSLAIMTPTDTAICKIWFDGTYLRLLLHVGSLRRELRLLGFEEGVASWLDKEMQNRFKGIGLKGQVRYLVFACFGFAEK
jgi:hypothetical protein